jgi:hypothetical protein
MVWGSIGASMSQGYPPSPLGQSKLSIFIDLSAITVAKYLQTLELTLKHSILNELDGRLRNAAAEAPLPDWIDSRIPIWLK